MMAASGTVTLQTALAGVPGVTCYRTSVLSALIGRWLVRMDRVILPNALLQREAYPFLFQQEATPAALAAHIESIFSGADEPTAQPDPHAVAGVTPANCEVLLRGGSDDFETLVAAALEPHFELPAEPGPWQPSSDPQQRPWWRPSRSTVTIIPRLMAGRPIISA